MIDNLLPPDGADAAAAPKPHHAPLCRAGFYSALGAWALVLLLTLFGPHACAPHKVEAVLKERVDAALTAQGLDSVETKMRGQRVLLAGTAPTKDAAALAERRALAAAGRGGLFFGGVTSVSSAILVSAPAKPFTFSARRIENGVVLSGHAPNQKAREAIAAEAKRLFGKVDDQVQLASGVPAKGDWLMMVTGGLGQLSLLDTGELRLSDTKLFLMGEAPAEAQTRVRAFYAYGLPKPYQANVDLTAPGGALAIPELDGMSLSQAGPADCQTAFGKLMETNVINFETNSAALSSSSLALLDKLAAVARRCDSFSIEVSGHTDNLGDRDANMALSEFRAQAVADYLAAQGVAPKQLKAKGLGPERPVAKNTTAAGRARNRRIEFTVSE